MGFDCISRLALLVVELDWPSIDFGLTTRYRILARCDCYPDSELCTGWW
jgi:hypothetical protein